MIRIELASRNNFSIEALDSFDRFQKVVNVFRMDGGKLVLVYNPFSEDWTYERKREKAEEILSGEYITFCAYDSERVVGEIMLVPVLNRGRMIVDSFHVSRDCRRLGIGRMLFEAASNEAVKHGAEALYISACSAEETINFYLAMGCYPSKAPIEEYAEEEPFDIQMEYKLHNNGI